MGRIVHTHNSRRTCRFALQLGGSAWARSQLATSCAVQSPTSLLLMPSDASLPLLPARVGKAISKDPVPVSTNQPDIAAAQTDRLDECIHNLPMVAGPGTAGFDRQRPILHGDAGGPAPTARIRMLLAFLRWLFCELLEL